MLDFLHTTVLRKLDKVFWIRYNNTVPLEKVLRDKACEQFSMSARRSLWIPNITKWLWVILLCYGSSVPARTGKQWFYIHISWQKNPRPWDVKNPDRIGVFRGYIFFAYPLWCARQELNLHPEGPGPNGNVTLVEEKPVDAQYANNQFCYLIILL